MPSGKPSFVDFFGSAGGCAGGEDVNSGRFGRGRGGWAGLWRRRGLKARSSERSVKESTERTFGVRRVKRPACVCSWPLGSRRPVGQSAVCPTCEDCGPGSPTPHNDQNPPHCDRGSALSHCRTAARRWPIRRPGAAGGRGETGSSRRLVAAPIVWRLAWADRGAG